MKAKSSTPAPTPGAYCQRLGAQSLVFPCKPSLPAGETRRHAEHHRSHSFGHRLRSSPGFGRARNTCNAENQRPRRFHAVLGVIRRAAQGISRSSAAFGNTREGGGRSWSQVGMGSLPRVGWRSPRVRSFWRFRASGGAVQIPAEAVADTARRVLFRAKGIATQHSWEQPKRSASN